MFWHYVRHNLRPSDYYAAGPGERIVLRAFMLKEIEEEKRMKKEIEDKTKGGRYPWQKLLTSS